MYLRNKITFNDAQTMNRFMTWILNDNVVECTKEIHGMKFQAYRTQCTQYQKLFLIDELINYYLKEYEEEYIQL